MFCKECGAELARDSQTCPYCGSGQGTADPAEPMDIADAVRSAAKKVGASTAFLIAVICLTFAQALKLALCASNPFAAFTGSALTVGDLTEMLSWTANMAGMLPGILTVLGLWITFFSCAGRKNRVNTSGLTVIFAVNLAQMVLSCLVLLAAMIPLAAMYTSADTLAKSLYYADAEIIETIVLGVALALLAVFILVLIYYIQVCATLSNIRSALRSGIPSKKVSRFVAVLCYISAMILILGGIFSLLSAICIPASSYYDGTATYSLHSEIFLSAAAALLTATAQILFGALIFTYRRKMKALEEEDRLTTFQTLSYAEPYTSPVYIPPEPAAEPEAAQEELDETKRWDC